MIFQTEVVKPIDFEIQSSHDFRRKSSDINSAGFDFMRKCEIPWSQK